MYRSIKEIQQTLYRQLFSDFEEIQKLVQKDPDIFIKASQLPQTSSYSPEQMLDYLNRVMTDDFPSLTVEDYEVKYVPESMESFSSPAFYLTPPVDTLTPNTIYINQSSTVSSTELFTTLAHEGFPGHLTSNCFLWKTGLPSCPSPVGLQRLYRRLGNLCGRHVLPLCLRFFENRSRSNGISPTEPFYYPVSVFHSGYRDSLHRLEFCHGAKTPGRLWHHRRLCLSRNLPVYCRKPCQLFKILSGLSEFSGFKKQRTGNPEQCFSSESLSPESFGNRPCALPCCEKISSYEILS